MSGLGAPCGQIYSLKGSLLLLGGHGVRTIVTVRGEQVFSGRINVTQFCQEIEISAISLHTSQMLNYPEDKGTSHRTSETKTSELTLRVVAWYI